MRRLLLLATAAVLATAWPAYAQTWNLVWSDEFNGAAGTFPDSTKWTYDVGNTISLQPVVNGLYVTADLDGGGRLIASLHEPVAEATIAYMRPP